MTLDRGTRFGAYEILAPLGAGGMGEVYRARDTKLERDVAIKVLPDAFALDRERLARFDREAKTLAAFNHPHIAQIFGFEQAGATSALVMELVEGEDLAQRLARGAIPVDEALAIAKQVADALDAAHERGVIHRDLKPANIRITPDGTVKILDFGLAKAAAADPLSDPANSPTFTVAATQMGVIVGTAAYMAPEQARGNAVDKRADIWAFGCVLYEMLVGRKAFEGADVSETLASVLKEEPDWGALPADAANVVPTLRACLQKNPHERLRDIGDARLGLRGAFDTSIGPVPSAAQWARRLVLAWTIAAVMTLVAGAAVTWPLIGTTPAGVATRFEIAIPATHRLFTGGGGEFALSPDGRTLAYIGALPNGSRQLFRHTLDEWDPVPIAGAAGRLEHVGWSPNGGWITFGTYEGRLVKVSATGGTPVTIADSPGYGHTWVDDNTIVFVGSQTGSPGTRLFRVSSDGGEPVALTTPEPGVRHLYPHVVPGHEVIVYTVWSGSVASARVAVRSLRTGEERVLFGGTSGRLLPTGHLVYAREDGIWAVAFDETRLSSVGEPRRVIENVQVNGGGLAIISASGGSIAYVSGSVASSRELVWLDRDGREHAVNSPRRPYGAPRVAPDGTRAALDVHDRESDIWVWDFNRQTLARVTFGPAAEHGATWSRDGRRLIFSSASENTPALFWQAADGTGALERVVRDSRSIDQPVLSPDGKWLVVRAIAPDTRDDILLLPLTGERRLQPLLHSSFNERHPDVSPDGRFIAYESDETGSLEVYVRPFPRVNDGRWQISNSGGRQPRWSADGRELFYLASDDTITSVPIEMGAGFKPGVAIRLIDVADYEIGAERAYDVSADGRRFLMLKREALSSTSIRVVLNWVDELKRLVPTN